MNENGDWKSRTCLQPCDRLRLAGADAVTTRHHGNSTPTSPPAPARTWPTARAAPGYPASRAISP